MSVTDTERIGRAYRVNADETGNNWEKYSFWTKASDVEMDDGQTLQYLIDKINPDPLGSVANAQNAENALYSSFAEKAEQAVSAINSDDVRFIGDSTVDKIVEIDGNQLITRTIRSPDTGEVVDPYTSHTETPATIDTDIKLGDSFATTIGKVKKKLADLTDQANGMRGVTTVTGVLHATSWNEGIYNLNNLFLPSKKRIITMPNADSISAEAYDAWLNAKVAASATSNNLKAFGTVPSVDIPVIFYVITIGEYDPSGGGGGGGGGTSDYNNLTNKPTINGVTLQGELKLSALMDDSSAVSQADIDEIIEDAFGTTDD